MVYSDRMIRQGDVITAYGRWLALIPVALIAVLGLPSDFQRGGWSVLNVTFCMAIIDAIPVLMLMFKSYPGWAAWVFVLLDSLFCLIVLYLGGPSMFFYCFVPVLAINLRFHWKASLLNALGLSVGHVLIIWVQGDIRQVLLGVLSQIVSVMAVSLLGGRLFDVVKREPPLNAQEVQARQQELSYWRAAADRAHAIYKMAGTLGATLNSSRILDAVLEVSTAGLDEVSEGHDPSRGRLASAIFLFGQDGRLYVAASRGLGYGETALTVPGEQGILRETLESSGPKVWGALADDPELALFTTFCQCQSAIGVPLCASFEDYGIALIASSRPDAFGVEHVEMLKAVSSQAAMALTNAHLYQDLQWEKEHILSIEEGERAKLARNLHDGPTQSISAIAMRLNYVRLLLDRDPKSVREELFNLEDLARRTTKDIRTLLFTMRPLILDTQGLKAAVAQLVERLFEQEGEAESIDGPTIDLEIEDIEGQLSLSIQAVAWSVVEESLTNVRKHSNARNVCVSMRIRDGNFIAEIRDDGVGFDVAATLDTYDQRISYGLLGLQERAALVNGRTTIESMPGKGVQITLVVPLSREVD